MKKYIIKTLLYVLVCISFLPDNAHSENFTGFSSGTGFYINSFGDMVTNAHVVSSCKSIKVGRSRKEQLSAEIIEIEPKLDIAIIRTKERPRAVAPLRFGVEYKKGDIVTILGYPGMAGISREHEVVQAEILDTEGINGVPGWIQITNNVRMGNSGGPLLDNDGNVIGIVTGILSSINRQNGVFRQVGMAINLEIFKRFLDKNFISYSQRLYVDMPVMGKRNVEQLTKDFIYNVHCYQ